MVKTRQDTYWMNPVPLWADGLEKSALPGLAASKQPVILRFVTDWFMDEFNQLLATDPSRMTEYRVQPETWRGFSRPALPKKEFEQSTVTLRRFGIELPVKKTVKTAVVSKKTSTEPLKLYQPAQQRFYLVTSSLICDAERLPDHPVDHSRNERAGFVIRRIWPTLKTGPQEDLGFPDSTWKEYAFTQQSDGTYAWNQVADNDYAIPQKNEEMLPMFPVNYASECAVHGRRLWAGLIPVGKREAYMGAMAVTSPTLQSNPITPITARKVLFRTLVSEPWKSLVDTAATFYKTIRESLDSGTEDNPVPSDASTVRLKQTRELIQTTSWLILADFRKFLMDYNKTVWDLIDANTPVDLTNPNPKFTLYNALNVLKLNESLATRLTSDMGASGTPDVAANSLAEALRLLTPSVVHEMEKSYKNFEIGEENQKFPPFLFPLTDPDLIYSPIPVIEKAPPVDDDSNDDFVVNNTADDENTTSDADQNNVNSIPVIDLELIPALNPDVNINIDKFTADFKEKIDQLAALVLRALDDDFEAGEPLVPLAAMQPADLREGWFKIRCVYERPLCPVHCDPEIVSEPTEPFQMAGFFDPDAPARPIRIGLPLDTTPSGLRKFNKNTAFVISDILCGQIKRFKEITFGDIVLSVLPWPFHKDLKAGSGGPCKSKGGLNMGMLCSLSIPIITLCALILLIIMVISFDYIFKWLPFFCLCFPVPGLKGKKK